jgi:hypothetical protein
MWCRSGGFTHRIINGHTMIRASSGLEATSKDGAGQCHPCIVEFGIPVFFEPEWLAAAAALWSIYEEFHVGWALITHASQHVSRIFRSSGSSERRWCIGDFVAIRVTCGCRRFASSSRSADRYLSKGSTNRHSDTRPPHGQRRARVAQRACFGAWRLHGRSRTSI